MTANESELDHREETAGELLKARGQAAMLLKPPYQALDDIAPSIRLGAEHRRPTTSAVAPFRFAPLRDDAPDAASAQVSPQAPSAVATVGDEHSGSATRAANASGGLDAHTAEQGKQALGVVLLPRSQIDRKRVAFRIT